MVALSILFRILAALLGAAMAGVAPIIDTKVLGKGIKPFGGDLEKHTWRSFKFVYMNYVGAVSSELREHMKAAADHPASVPLSCMAPEIRHESNTLAYMLSQVLEGAALVMIMNIEEGNGFEMWRSLVKHYEPELGAYSVSGLRQVLGFKFRTGDWQHYLEDLEIFEGRVTSWEKTSGDLLSDSIMQALVKEGTHEKLRQQVETTTFTNFRELKRTLVSHCLTEISRLPEGGGINYFQKGGKQQSKGDGKYGKQQKGKDMKGKSKGKTEKGWKGKGAAKSSDKPAYFDGACSGCGKWGHKKKDCWGEKSKMQVNAVASSGASSTAGTSTVGGGSSSGGGVYAITEHARSSPPVPTDPEDGWILMMSGKAEKWTI